MNIDSSRLTVAVSGASGALGTELCASLVKGGHAVRRLVRRPARQAGEIQWDPSAGILDRRALDGVDAVVHLAGENVAGGRWTEERKRAISESREKGTALLAGALAGLAQRPRVFVSSSAIGIYGDRADEAIDEQSAPGEGFLADVCKRWEAATGSAVDAGIRTVILRTGIVLTPRDGALGKMLLPFKAGLGGKIGTGRQWMSWIAVEDWVSLVLRALTDATWQGPYDATAPVPVRQEEFARTLAGILRRPAIAPLPAFAVKIMFGEMGTTVLLGGAKVLPSRALRAGFEFQYPELEGALRHVLGR